MINFIIHSETPAKKNSRITLKNGRSIPSERYRKWHDTAQLEILTQKKGFNYPIEKPVKIKVTFTHGDKRRRDSDNGLSSVLDLLTDCFILSDDNWEIVREIKVINLYEKNNAKAEIQIEELEE